MIFLALQDPKLFVDAKRRSVFRGFEGVRKHDLSFRELPDASANRKDRRLNEEKTKKSLNKLDTNENLNNNDKKEGKSLKIGNPHPKGRQGDKNNDKNATPSPTSVPTSEPTSEPTRPVRTKAPKIVETQSPTSAPTNEPTSAPTNEPTSASTEPTNAPTEEPTSVPTKQTVAAPTTKEPTSAQTEEPTSVPTKQTVAAPTMTPTNQPTMARPSPAIMLTPSTTLFPIREPIAPTTSPTKVLVSEPDPTEYPTSPYGTPTSAATTAESDSPVSEPVSQPITIQFKPSSNPVSDETMAPTVGSTEAPTMLITEIEFDEAEFIDAEKFKPITFHMTVSKLTQITNQENLELYFKDFIEDVLDMDSNQVWYPINVKSIGNITVDFMPTFVLEGEQGAPSQRNINYNFPVELIVNGLVFVHLNEQQNQETLDESESISKFHDFFEHRLLLYFSFWGVDSLQEVLIGEGGLQNPFIHSVSVGKKVLITFDKDGNYLYDDDDGSSNSIEETITNIESKSSEIVPNKSLLTFIMISSTILWYL